MIQKITSYDLLQLPIRLGQIYYVSDSRCLYKDMGYTRNERMRLSAIVLNTDYERNNSIRPQNGKQYYVIENNFLWEYDTKWTLIDGDIKQFNTYGYSSLSGISPVINTDSYITSNITGDRIIDNNGLLGDGSVAVRDSNRIIKGLARVDGPNASIAVQSYLDNGFSFYPYALFSGTSEKKDIGSLHLGVSRELTGDGLVQQLEHIGNADYYGNFNIHGTGYIVNEVEYTKYSLTTLPGLDEELTFTFDSFITEKAENGISYIRSYRFTIKVLTKNSATIRIVTYTNQTSPTTVNDAGQLIYDGPTLVESDITYEATRIENNSLSVTYTIVSTGESFTLLNDIPSPIVEFSNADKYTDSDNDVVATSALIQKRKFMSMLEILRVE